MAAAVGAIGATSFIYGFPVVILALMGIILGVWLITRNLVLGNAVSLLLLPLSVWLVTDSTMAAWLAAVLLGVIVVKYIPDGVADYKRRGLEGLGRDDLNPKM